MTDHLDTAYEALRAWCHDRPDRDDPSITYNALGKISSIIPTLGHIIELVPRATARPTGSDDGRSVTAAHDEIAALTRNATRSLDDAFYAIRSAHEVVGHLIFAVGDEDTGVDD